MKRQIDPNLNSAGNGDFSIENVLGAVDSKNKINDNNDIDDIIGSLSGMTNDDSKDKAGSFSIEDKGITEEDKRNYRRRHHHSSSGSHSHGEHSHHSSGEHHHSSSHHSSSGSHSHGEHSHHSSGEHHHSSSHHSSSGSHSHGEHSHHSSGEHHHSSSHHSSSGKHHHSGSHHSSKSKKKKGLSTVSKVIISLIAILLAIIIAFVGTFYFLQYKGKKDVKTVVEEVEYSETIEYKGHTYEFNEDVVAFAFMGIDQRVMQTNEQTDFVGSADADIVIAINTKTGEANVIAIPRDTMVEIDMYSESGMFLKTERSQLCLAYAYGDGQSQSCQNVVKGMSRILKNVPIQKYFALNLDGIAPLNDAIGGVTVDALYSMPEYGIFKGETITLKGDNAEHYVRTRDMVDINASLNRTDRQVQYVKAFVNQLVPAVLKDFGIISRLYNTASNYSQSNITLSNVTYMASLALSKNVTSFETYTLKGEMHPSKKTKYADVVYAEFTPNEDSVMEAVLASFYTQVK